MWDYKKEIEVTKMTRLVFSLLFFFALCACAPYSVSVRNNDVLVDGNKISKVTVDDSFKYAGKFRIPGQKGRSFVFSKTVTNSLAVAYIYNPYWAVKYPGAACARDCFVIDNKDFELNGELYDSMLCIHKHPRFSSGIYTLERSIKIESREGYNLALLYLEEFPESEVPFGNWYDKGITEKQKKIIAKFDKDIRRFVSLTGKPK